MDPSSSPASPVPAGKTSVLSIVSLLAGILGLPGVCLGFLPGPYVWLCWGGGGFFGLAAVVTGAVGLAGIRKRAERGKGMAISGIVIGALVMLGVLIYVLVLLALMLLGPANSTILN